MPSQTILDQFGALIDQAPVGTVVVWSEGSRDPGVDALAEERAERMRRPGGLFGL